MNKFAAGTLLLLAITGVLDAGGNPTTFKSAPTWQSSDPTILSLKTSDDGLSATGTAEKEGTVTITAIGDGVSESIAITVASGDVVSFQISVSVAPAA
jgi:hypothetical protein